MGWPIECGSINQTAVYQINNLYEFINGNKFLAILHKSTGSGWHIMMFQTSRWLQNKRFAWAWPGQAKKQLLFWNQREVLNNVMCRTEVGETLGQVGTIDLPKTDVTLRNLDEPDESVLVVWPERRELLLREEHGRQADPRHSRTQLLRDQKKGSRIFYKKLFIIVQRSAKVLVRGLVKLVPALA